MKTNHCKSFFHDVPPQMAIPIQSHRSPPDFPIVVALCCMEKSPCSHLEEACCKSGPAPSSRDVLRGIPWIDGPQQHHPTNSNNHGIWRAAKIGKGPQQNPVVWATLPQVRDSFKQQRLLFRDTGGSGKWTMFNCEPRWKIQESLYAVWISIDVHG